MPTKSEYRKYIASEAWMQRRKVFLSAHPECERCGVSREMAARVYDQDLHVHHRNYQRVGAELDSDMEALCRRCHEIETFGKSKLPACMTLAERKLLRSLIGGEVPETRRTKHGLEGLFS